MKKTLAALIIGAFAASAANAAVIYDNEGTKVEVGGSLRLILEKTNKTIKINVLNLIFAEFPAPFLAIPDH